MRKNPAIYISIIAALLALAVSFGVRISGTQSQAIINLAELAIPLIVVGGGAAIRANVYSPDSVEKALDMPQGSPASLLDRVIETGVKVNSGDTKADVVEKVNKASQI